MNYKLTSGRLQHFSGTDFLATWAEVNTFVQTLANNTIFSVSCSDWWAPDEEILYYTFTVAYE